jgi:ribosomal protein L28
MSRACDLTDTKKSFGHNMKHRRGSSGGGGKWRYKSTKTNRAWIPNLRKVDVLIEGVKKRIKVSMKAYKTLRNKGNIDGVKLAK